MKKRDRIKKSKFKMLSKNFPSIIPVDGKQPTEKGWTQHCCEPRDFSSRDFKGLNAGLPTGPANRLIVLDIDNIERFKQLKEENGWKLPESFSVETGGGGLHIYYQYPMDGRKYGCHNYRDPEDKTRTVFDIKGVGGMVVAPGSIHPETGRRYRVLHDLPIAEAPAWLLSLCVKENRPSTLDGVKVAGPKILADLLFKLEAKQTGANQWIALCPAHDDKKPSLSISLAPNGTILLYCHGGCSTENVVQATGYRMSDLFPKTGFSVGSLGVKLSEKVNPYMKKPKRAVSGILCDSEAMDALALASLGDLPSFESTMLRLKSKGVTARDIQSLRNAVKSIRKRREMDQSTDFGNKGGTLVKDMLPEAPVSDTAILPPGWTLSADGLFRRHAGKNSEMRISPQPVLVQGIIKNLLDASEDVRLAWKDKEKWHYRVVNRVEIADVRQIVALADFGFPVTSNTAAGLVSYLAAYEASNLHQIPWAMATHQLGWQKKDGVDSFLCGRNLITADGLLTKDIDIDQLSPDTWPDNLIFFKGHDRGEEQIARAFRQKGSFEKWSRIIDLIKDYPLVTFGVYAALAAPLLPLLNSPIYVVDWAYSTSSGKTTTLKIAASCWGDADQRSENPVIRSWDTTRVWLERAAAVLNCLPLILDETKRAKNAYAVIQAIYDLSSGQGRGRGSLQGMRSTSHWQTSVLLSGESKSVDFSAGEGGTIARVITLWGAPFGKKSAETAKDIQRIEKIIHRHFGHVGPKLIQYLLENRKKWPKFREKHQELITEYQSEAGNNQVALRQAVYFATIHMAAWLAKKALKFDIKYKRHLKKVFKMAMRETIGADRAKEALELVISWAESNRESFLGNEKSDRVPNGGWLGIWNPNVEASSRKSKRTGDWEELEESDHSKLQSLAVFPHHLKKVLKTEGYESLSMLRLFKDKGWLDVIGEKKGLTKKITRDGERHRCYVLNEKAIQKAKN